MRHADVDLTRPCWLSASEALRRFADGSLTSAALVADCRERIDEREADIRAWVHLASHPVGSAPGRPPSGPLAGGPLAGIPVGVKDVFDTTDQPTAYGYARYEGFRPRRDAAAVALLRAAGAVILGKTVTAEFAYFHPGPTCNPHDLTHTPGGSSSGSAAAVADGMVPVAIGTQTVGSVIRPAAFCGVVGYKPSFGWVPRAGSMLFASSLDTVGVFARTVEDAVLVGEALTGRHVHAPDPGRGVDADRAPRLGFDPTDQWDHLHPEARAMIERTVDALAAGGLRVDEVRVADEQVVVPAARTILAFEAVRALAHEWATDRDGISVELRDLLAQGASISPAHYDEAQATLAVARVAAEERLARFDAVLTPSALGPAPRGLATTGDPACNRVWTTLGVPCLHLPLGASSEGLPLGVQLVGRYGTDPRVLAAGDWITGRLEADR